MCHELMMMTEEGGDGGACWGLDAEMLGTRNRGRRNKESTTSAVGGACNAGARVSSRLLVRPGVNVGGALTGLFRYDY